MATPAELIEALDRLRNLMIDHATGRYAGEGEYVELRRIVVMEERLTAQLPPFVRDCRTTGDFWSFITKQSAKYEPRRQYLREAFAPVLVALEAEACSPGDLVGGMTLERVDSDHVHDAWRKVLARRHSDPDGAITAARSLIEAVCKHILDQSGTPYDDHADLPKLYHLVAQRLRLSPAQHIEPTFKQILGGCQTVVEGLAAIRNRLSDAHGKGQRSLKPAPRHAELAVNLAGTMATFLIATWESQPAREMPRSDPPSQAG
jgi:Abortive infection C-terminus